MKRMMAMLLGLALLMTAVAACAENAAPTFEQLSKLQWEFSSGVGGWSTEMQISEDGSFNAQYHDSEMGETGENYPNGSVYTCEFSGQMSILDQVDEHSWKVHVDKVAADEATGKETFEDGVRYVTSDSTYGIVDGDDMVLYLPGTPVDALTEDMKMWAHLLGDDAPAELENWFLYSAKNETGFVGYAAED